uniref:F-box-like family protein n=1 Tax=Pithovirus LCPAC404 TaxID=2506597 RepID=A0A481ZCT6_9VIRU|nr:MAG: uncharacterized protein LCPAC404_02910 [Pithovirus LCPAC404]
MNSDRSVNELLEVFGISNISNLGSDVIIKFFDDISVKEVMKLCRVNKQFNAGCWGDSMWKRKVENDYGVETKYGRTWKDTAQFLSEYNMINLNETWVNGKTYKELLDESLESKNDNYFKDLRDKYKLGEIIFPSYVHDIQTAKEFVLTRESWGSDSTESMPEEEKITIYERFNRNNGNILEDENRLKKQVAGMTREFAVIVFASAEIKGTYTHNNFGLSSLMSQNLYYSDFSEDVGIELSTEAELKIKKLTRMVDPNLYIMTYSVMSPNNLVNLDIWQERGY